MTIKDNVTGIQHIGIPTQNIQKTIEFYNWLGFETILETQNPSSNERVAFLCLKNLMVETWESENACGCCGPINHIALDVSEVESLFVTLKSEGYEILDSTVQFLPFWKHGVKFFTIKGPNEEKIEFCQIL